MSATVILRRRTVTVDDGEWSGDPDLALTAAALSKGAVLSGYIPDLDYHLAKHVAEVLGGAVVPGPPPPFDPDVVY